MLPPQRLVWSNCYLFNGKDSSLGRWAQQLEKRAEDGLAAISAKHAVDESAELKRMQRKLNQMKRQVHGGLLPGG